MNRRHSAERTQAVCLCTDKRKSHQLHTFGDLNGDQIVLKPLQQDGGTTQAPRPRILRVFQTAIVAVVLSVFVAALLPSINNTPVSDDWVFLYAALKAKNVIEILSLTHHDWFVRPTIWMAAEVLTNRNIAPWRYHIFLLLGHLLNAGLIWALCRLVMRASCSPSEASSQRRNLDFSILAPASFLSYSLSHEAIFWFASAPEILALFFRLLSLVLLGLLYRRPRLEYLLIPGLPLLTAAALASKESAVVAPEELLAFLLLFAVLRSGPLRLRLLRSWKALAGIVLSGLVTVGWFFLAWGAATARDGLQLLHAAPWSWALRLSQATVRSIFLGLFLESRSTVIAMTLLGLSFIFLAWFRRRYAILFATCWLFLCLLPYVAISSLADNAAGVPVLLRRTGTAEDRYYYCAAAGLALLGPLVLSWLHAEITRHVSGMRWRESMLSAAMVGYTVWLGAQAGRLIHFERQWEVASAELDRVIAKSRQELTTPVASGAVVCVTTRPDNYKGRFVLRNGVAEILYLGAGRDDFTVLVPPWIDKGTCTRSLSLDVDAHP